MRQRQEHHLELRRREVHPLGEHAMEEAGEARRVGAPGTGIVAHLLDAEEQGQQRPHAIDAGRNPRRGDRLPQLSLGEGTESIESRVRIPGVAHGLQGGQAGRDAERVPGKRPGLIDRAAGRELFHQRARATEGTYR